MPKGATGEMWIVLKRSVVEGFRSIFSHGLMSFASVGTVTVSLTVLAFFLLVAANLSFVADVLEAQVEIVAYCHADFDRQWETTLVEKVEDIDGVREVEFVSREEAFERLREQFGERAELLEAVEDDNPLRDSVEVTVMSAADTERVAEEMGEIQSVERVDYQREVVERIHAMTEALRSAGIILVFLLAGVTFLLISNTVRITIYARRKEIEIMRLVGASAGYISGPLLFEGTVLGIMGAALSGGAIAWGYADLFSIAQQSLPFVPLVGPRPLLDNLFQILLGCGALIGFVSSWFSVRRYLKY